MVERNVVIQNEGGLHARPASLLVQQAGKFSCNIHLIKKGASVDIKSILGVLSISASKGEVVTIRTEGEDEQEALEYICNLIEDGLGEVTEA